MKKSELRQIIRETIKETFLAEQTPFICQQIVVQMQSQGMGFAMAGLDNVQGACCPKCPSAQNDPGDDCYAFCNHDCCPSNDPCDELTTNPMLAGCCDKCAANLGSPGFENDACFPYCDCCRDEEEEIREIRCECCNRRGQIVSMAQTVTIEEGCSSLNMGGFYNCENSPLSGGLGVKDCRKRPTTGGVTPVGPIKPLGKKRLY